MPEAWIETLLSAFSWNQAFLLKSELLETLKKCQFRQHPLGFVHAALNDSEDMALRFHIWKPGFRQVQQPSWLIHTHTFELTSLILFGELSNSVYRWNDNSNTGTGDKQIYEAHYQNGLSQISRTDRTGSIHLEDSIEATKGSQYTVPLRQFHETTVAIDTFAATIAVAKKYGGNPLIVGDITGDKILLISESGAIGLFARFTYQRCMRLV